MTEWLFARLDDVDASAAQAATEAAEAARDVAVQAAEDAQAAVDDVNADADRAEAAATAAEAAQTAAELAETNAESAEAGAEAAQAAAVVAQGAAETAEANAETAEAHSETAQAAAEAAQAAAEGAASDAAADAVATAADRVQTGLDVTAAAGSASTATTQAGIATTQAGIATTQAGTATTQAGLAAGSASDASDSADDAAAAAASLNAGALNLAGGTVGQVATKVSSADYDFTWTDPATGTGTVTSVDVDVPTGLTSTGGPITTSGTITLAWGAGYEGFTTVQATLLSNVAANIDGGTTGQILTKTSGTDYDYAWADAPSTGVTSIGITPPAAGIGVSGSPVTSSGNITLSLNGDLAGLEGLATVGYMVRTGTNTYATRSFTAPAAGLSFTNTAGVSGNTVFSLTNDLAAVEGLATTGIVRRTATDTWSAGTDVALSELATIGTMTVLGNNTGGSAVPAALSKAQTVALLDAAQLSVAGQALTGGANTDRRYLGNTSGGNISIDPGTGPVQLLLNGGAAVVSPASGKYGIAVLIISNTLAAATLTFTGFTVTGDAFTNTNGHRWVCTIVQTQDYAHLIASKVV